MSFSDKPELLSPRKHKSDNGDKVSSSSSASPTGSLRNRFKRYCSENIETSSGVKLMRYSISPHRYSIFPSGCLSNNGHLPRGGDYDKKGPTESKRSQKKCVRFERVQNFISSKFSFSEDEAKELWFGMDECFEMSKASKRHLRHIHRKHYNDTVRHLLCVASQCSYSPPPTAYLQLVRLNLPDESRGLELGLLPLRIRRRRQTHVRRVVEVQSQIVSGKIPIKNVEQMKAKALAIQSMQSSQASKLFAQLVARNVAQETGSSFRSLTQITKHLKSI